MPPPHSQSSLLQAAYINTARSTSSLLFSSRPSTTQHSLSYEIGLAIDRYEADWSSFFFAGGCCSCPASPPRPLLLLSLRLSCSPTASSSRGSAPGWRHRQWRRGLRVDGRS
uniref:Uncharacterized protein n=1 Tax=Oryza punctata TaxID=4537 RepID=A0A0E0MJM2_ORYPU